MNIVFLPNSATRVGIKCFNVICSPRTLSWQPLVDNFLKSPGYHKLKALFPKIKKQNIFYHDIIAIKTSSSCCVGIQRPREV